MYNDAHVDPYAISVIKGREVVGHMPCIRYPGCVLFLKLANTSSVL